MNENFAWGIHAGHSGEADMLFLSEGCIAVSCVEIGDLSGLPADRSGFCGFLPDQYSGTALLTGSALHDFVHGIQAGDMIIYPSKHERCIYLGICTGPYYFENHHSRYGSRRPVTWKAKIPRTHFSQGALDEVGCALTLFQVRNHLDEFKAALCGRTQLFSVAFDPAVAAVSEESQEYTRDFILKRLVWKLKGHAFEDFVEHLLQTMGYKTKRGGGPGVDIVVHRDELSFETPLIKVRVKSSEESIGQLEVSGLHGHLSQNEFGMFVCLGSFTKQAKEFAKTRANLRLIDGEQLAQLVISHYEDLNSHYKTLLPLNLIYVPEAVAD